MKVHVIPDGETMKKSEHLRFFNKKQQSDTRAPVKITNEKLKSIEETFQSDEDLNLSGDKRENVAYGLTSMKIPLKSMSSESLKVQSSHIAAPRTISRRLKNVMIHAFMPWGGSSLCYQFFRSSQNMNKEYERHKTEHPFIIHPFSIFRMGWDIVMVLILFVTIIVLPLEVAFFSDNLWDAKWMAFNLIVDSGFIIDIIINMRTGFINANSDQVILDDKTIAINYLKKWFILDLISSLPFDYLYLVITDNTSGNAVFASTLRALRLVKFVSLLRIFRFIRLFRYLDRIKDFFHVDAKVLSILRLVIMILIFAHWNACVSFMIVYLQGFPETSWIVVANMHHENVTVWSRYTYSLFRGMSHMISIGYGRAPPQGDSETWMLIVSMMMGASFYALFIAHVSAIVMSLDASGRHFQEKVSEVTEYMKYRRLPAELQTRVLEYYDYKYQQKYFDEHSILGERSMSYPLRKEILMHNCRSLVQSVPFLATAPSEFLVNIILKLNMHVYFPGESIIQAGKRGTSMYFIEHGKVKVQLPSGEVVNTLQDGTHFGEVSLLFVEKRIANVIADEICYIYRLSKSDFEEVLGEFPEMRKVMLTIARERMQDTHRKLGYNTDMFSFKVRSIHNVSESDASIPDHPLPSFPSPPGDVSKATEPGATPNQQNTNDEETQVVIEDVESFVNLNNSANDSDQFNVSWNNNIIGDFQGASRMPSYRHFAESIEQEDAINHCSVNHLETNMEHHGEDSDVPFVPDDQTGLRSSEGPGIRHRRPIHSDGICDDRPRDASMYRYAGRINIE